MDSAEQPDDGDGGRPRHSHAENAPGDRFADQADPKQHRGAAPAESESPVPGQQRDAPKPPAAQAHHQRPGLRKPGQPGGPIVGRRQVEETARLLAVGQLLDDRQQAPRIPGRRRQAEERSGDGDRVGNGLFVQVDQRGHGHQQDQHPMARVLGVEVGQESGREGARQVGGQEGLPIDFPPIEPRGSGPGEQLDQQRPYPKRPAVQTRLSPQTQPAQDRHTVAPAARRGVLGRGRPGADRPRPPSQSVHAQVHQRPGHRPKAERDRQTNDNRHVHD